MTKHCIAVIGAGGKTTAMGVLARQSGAGSVLLTTTTHILPMMPPDCRVCLKDPAPEELRAALALPGIVCAGSAEGEKLTVLPETVLRPAMAAADLTIYEGDGSRRLPLKLHRAGEPVLLPATTRCLVVAGLSALGQPAGEVIHRYAGVPERPVDAEELLHCVLETVETSKMPKERIRVFLNQADACEDTEMIRAIINTLQQQGLDTRTGSLRQEPAGLYDWVTG